MFQSRAFLLYAKSQLPLRFVGHPIRGFGREQYFRHREKQHWGYIQRLPHTEKPTHANLFELESWGRSGGLTIANGGRVRVRFLMLL